MGLWGGRFEEPPDDLLRQLNDSIGFDQRIYVEDIAGSIAYADALSDAGVISQAEADVLQDGLRLVKTEFDEGVFEFKSGDEDIHTAVERRLIEIVGVVGGKLHTGRSRNDQVATDFRLWVMKAIEQIDEQVFGFQSMLVKQAETHVETIMPGYTHLQPAQPITVAHWLMSYFWMLARDRERLKDAHQRASVMPLGSGALAGTSLQIDRVKLAKELGFVAISQNSLDAVSDRDFVAETLFCFSLIGVHLSRLSEDILLYSNPLFGYITLNDRYSTGSSLMPQKRNADPAELARGKAGRLIGHLSGLLISLKGLPAGYNKDLQEDKEPIFDAYDTLMALLPVLSAMIATLQLNPEKMWAALSEDMLATDLADYLVDKGMPFRDAHHIVGRVVRFSQENDLGLSQIEVEDLKAISALFADDVTEAFDFNRSVNKRRTTGGTASAAVREQLEQARKLLSES